MWKSFLLFLFGRSSFDCGRVAIFLCFIFNHRRLALLESRIYSILRAVNFNIWEVTADMIIYYPIYEFSQQGNFISLHLMLLLRGESSFWQFHSCYNFHIGWLTIVALICNFSLAVKEKSHGSRQIFSCKVFVFFLFDIDLLLIIFLDYWDSHQVFWCYREWGYMCYLVCI